MTLPKMLLTPAYSGFSASPAADTLQAQLDGGPSRFRLNQTGAAVTVQVQWGLTRNGFNYLEAFFRLLPGSMPFLIDLIIDNADLTEYTARLVPGSKQLAGVQGLQRIVTAQLEVKPTRSDPAVDAAIVALYGAYGEAGRSVLDRLAQLVNEDPWPEGA